MLGLSKIQPKYQIGDYFIAKELSRMVSKITRVAKIDMSDYIYSDDYKLSTDWIAESDITQKITKGQYEIICRLYKEFKEKPEEEREKKSDILDKLVNEVIEEEQNGI